MKACISLLTLWLVTAGSLLQGYEVPVVFARSGQKATLRISGNHRAAVLWAYSHAWGEPVMFKNGTVEFTAPKVRVPVVFQVLSVADPKSFRGFSEAEARPTLGVELVVYPDRLVRWDKDTRVAAVGVPDWFRTWSQAVGLPVQKFKELKSLDTGSWLVPEKPSLMILGGKGLGISPASFWPIADERKINVLVLDPDWFNRNVASVGRKVVLSPKQTTGPLADLQKQDWPLPPTFRQGFLYVANRQTWIAGAEHPLVEEIYCPQNGYEHWRTVFSYLPWQEQLGRCEMADELFLRLLTETAKVARDRPPLDGRWRLLYPAAKDIKLDERPVLAAALKSIDAEANKTAAREVRAYVLDLRGKASPPSDFFDGTGALKTVEALVDIDSPLLILGDNPILDTWKWLKLDRQPRRLQRTGVLWWPDSFLPPSMESQLRLMQLFTEWNISLGDIPQEASNEDRKNEP